MIDHMGIPVKDLAESKAFYIEALKGLGYAVLMDIPEVCGIGPKGEGEKWAGTVWLSPEEVQSKLHVAFRVMHRALVDEFYKAALAAGGKDNGAPGLRPHYHENYYGAFVLDPNGHNIEVVCHEKV